MLSGPRPLLGRKLDSAAFPRRSIDGLDHLNRAKSVAPVRARRDASINRIGTAEIPAREVRDMHAEIEHRAAARLRGIREPFLPRRPPFGTSVREARTDEIRRTDNIGVEGTLHRGLQSPVAALH